MTQNLHQLIVASPRGFCAGVVRAVEIIKMLLKKYGAPIYVNHPIVHNNHLVENFTQQGVIFGASIEKTPIGSIFVFSAHGSPPQLIQKARKRGLKVIDATCPLVHKVHQEIINFLKQDYRVIYIGQKNHQEYQGVKEVGPITLIETLAEAKKFREKISKDQKIACLSQTTLSQSEVRDIIHELKKKIPQLKDKNDICYASENRQNAVKAIAEISDYVVIIGSDFSSNSNQLVKVAQLTGTPAGLFDSYQKIPKEIFQYQRIGLSSGASVPNNLVYETIQAFRQQNPDRKIIHQKPIIEEKVTFMLPAI